jgi:hypothetical protein
MLLLKTSGGLIVVSGVMNLNLMDPQNHHCLGETNHCLGNLQPQVRTHPMTPTERVCGIRLEEIVGRCDVFVEPLPVL